MTETAALVSVSSPFRTTEGSTGRVLPGQELKLDDSGEILVRGRNITPGYWGAQTEKEAKENGWFRTGDIGAMDASGNLFLKGRTKDVIVTAAGMKIFPEDLEAALDRQPEVRASAVVGIDGEHGQEPVAALILRHDRVDADEVIRRANQTLAEHQQMRRWLLWPEPDFPRTTTQKIRKLPVAEFMRRRHKEDPVAMKTPQALADVITRVSGQAPAHTTPEANLGNDLMLDSLARVELLSVIEEHYRINIDESAFTAMTTVGDIERLVKSESNGDAETRGYTYPRWAQRLPVLWLRALIYYLLLLPLTKLLCWTQTSGRDKVAAMKEPALFVANHVTAVDAALIMSALPGRYRRKLTIAMSGEILNGYLHPPVGTPLLASARLRLQYLLLVSLFNVFPLPRKSGFRKSFAYAGESMDRGYSILVFPEGERTQDGKMHTFQSGIGILAAGLEAPVVPVKISGLYELKILRRRVAPPGMVKVAFGDAVKFGADMNSLEIAQELQKRVASL
jgi:long-chain acyl-CoA synthetase